MRNMAAMNKTAKPVITPKAIMLKFIAPNKASPVPNQ